MTRHATAQGRRRIARQTIRFTARILRKQEDLPRYVVVSPEHVAGRGRAFEAEVTLNGAGPFLRTIRSWGRGSDVFFFNLTGVQCRKAGLSTGAPCEIVIAPLD